MLKTKAFFKKFVMVVVSLLVSCSFLSVGAAAQENNENTDLSEEELEILAELYEIDPDFTYEGKLVSVSKETRIMETEEQRLSSGSVMERGAIGNNYMTIYITASQISQSGRDTFNLTATATWKLTPTFRAQDAFAVSWGNGFALVSSSAMASYKSLGTVSDKTSQISMSPNAGVGYSVEASHYYGQALEWVRIYAQISQYNSSGMANASAAYCHKTVAFGGIGVTFGANANIMFNVVGANDTMSSYTTFTY